MCIYTNRFYAIRPAMSRYLVALFRYCNYQTVIINPKKVEPQIIYFFFGYAGLDIHTRTDRDCRSGSLFGLIYYSSRYDFKSCTSSYTVVPGSYSEGLSVSALKEDILRFAFFIAISAPLKVFTKSYILS